MDLSHLSRIRLAHLPTPLEELHRLSDHLGGPRILVKRDDATGLATGGNKTRKLEFLLADALDEGADLIITVGALQSNHARQTAAACARLGLDCLLVLEELSAWPHPEYFQSGNVILDDLFGARVMTVSEGADLLGEAMGVAANLLEDGRRPYVIPSGGSNGRGALGYVAAAGELREQAAAIDVTIDAVVCATGSVGTQAGLLVGLAGSDVPVVGVSVDDPATVHTEKIQRVMGESWQLLRTPAQAVAIDVLDQYVGGGYGVPTDAMKTAVRLVAEKEGVLLDPVYTGKAMAGLIDQIQAGRWSTDDVVVFLHTGGVPGLFAYRRVFGD